MVKESVETAIHKIVSDYFEESIGEEGAPDTTTLSWKRYSKRHKIISDIESKENAYNNKLYVEFSFKKILLAAALFGVYIGFRAKYES